MSMSDANRIAALETQARADAQTIAALRELCAAMYQAAGAYDMPVRFLDALFAAGNEECVLPGSIDKLLPCDVPDLAQRAEAAEQRVRELRSAVERARDCMLLLVRGKPVRDMDETIGEINAALARSAPDSAGAK